MVAPLLLNSLDEAATWLKQETRTEWNARSVVDACFRYLPLETRRSEPSLTYLRAAPPIGTAFSLHRWVPGAGAGMVRQCSMPWSTLRLYHVNLGQLLACGATTVQEVSSESARDSDDPGNANLITGKFVWADERVTIGLANVVISGSSLCELAAQIKADSVSRGASTALNAIEHLTAKSTSWKINARKIGEQLLKEKDRSIDKLAEAVRQEMTVRHAHGESGMTKRGGKLIPDAASIKRWALDSIKT